MATAKDCFAENVQLIGRPPVGNRELSIQWNLNNGLRMLAEQVTQLQSDQRRLASALDDIQRTLRNMS